MSRPGETPLDAASDRWFPGQQICILEWQQLGDPQPGGNTLWDDQDIYSSIKVDSANPWISYYDKFNRHLALTHWNGSQWVKETIDPNGETGRQSALYLDGSGVPHMAYARTSNADLMYVKWSK